ncbi:hypothetical protein Tco_0963790 [Tanacetum coccineum]
MLRKHHKVDEYHNDMPLIYYAEGHSLYFGRPEFALITGMRFGTISFCSYTSADLKFRNRVFPHKVGLVVINLDVLGVIEDEVMSGNLCDEDSVRLCLILALEVIFMGRLLTCPVDDSLFGLVENLEAWNSLLKEVIVGELMPLKLYQEQLDGLKSPYSKDLIVVTFLQRTQRQIRISDLLELSINLRGTGIMIGRRRKDSFGTGKKNSTGEDVEVRRREDVAVGRREDVADCEELNSTGKLLTKAVEVDVSADSQARDMFNNIIPSSCPH